MKIDSTVTTIKNSRRRVIGYSAHFHSLGTAKEHLTKDEATADLAAMIAFRCKYESAEVKIVTVRGHVGVFSFNLHGDMASRHVWPDGTVALCSGIRTIAEAVDSFRYHVAQITWNGTLEPSDILTDAQQGELRHWGEFQLRYKYAHDTLGLKDGDAHQYACDSRNSYLPATAPAAVESRCA
jgi:hypothetical protein